MRVLFDTTILIRAAKPGSGPAKEAVLRGISAPCTFVCSEFILDEVSRALRYPRLRSHLGLSDTEIQGYVDELRRDSVNVAEMYRYSTTLRSLTQGRAWHAEKFSHYEEVAPDVQEKVVAEAAKHRDKDTEKE